MSRTVFRKEPNGRSSSSQIKTSLWESRFSSQIPFNKLLNYKYYNSYIHIYPPIILCSSYATWSHLITHIHRIMYNHNNPYDSIFFHFISTHILYFFKIQIHCRIVAQWLICLYDYIGIFTMLTFMSMLAFYLLLVPLPKWRIFLEFINCRIVSLPNCLLPKWRTAEETYCRSDVPP